MRVHWGSGPRKLTVMCVVSLLFVWSVIDTLAAPAGQIPLNGRVKHIDLALNTVVVTDYEGKDVTLVIEDSEIMNKFRYGLIKIGDDVNVKYRIKDGKNIPFSFRKTAGC
jgi:hypothetical protein